MSIDWPVKSEDIKDLIINLEKELTKKDIEIRKKNELINKLISSIEENKTKYREIKAKLEYVKEEIKKLENHLEKSRLKLVFMDKEVEDIKKTIESKKKQKYDYNLENKMLKDKFNHLYPHNDKFSISASEKILKQIKESLFLKGFLSEKEYEELIPTMNLKE